MSKLLHAFFIFIVVILFVKSGKAQTSLPDQLIALRINESITLDGDLNEPAWQKAKHISNFTQREMKEGGSQKDRSQKTSNESKDFQGRRSCFCQEQVQGGGCNMKLSMNYMETPFHGMPALKKEVSE